MTTQWWQDDALLSDALARALGAGQPLSARLARDAKAVYTWRLIDAEIAQLAYDSVLDHDPALAALRAQTAPLRMLTFRCADVTIELGVSDDVLTGQVVPPTAGTVEVRQAGTVTARVAVDDLGCFSIEPVPRTAFVLRLTIPSGRTVATPEITI